MAFDFIQAADVERVF